MAVAAALVLAVLLPGMGLVFIGWLRTGSVLGVVFAAGLDLLLAGTLLAPGALPTWVVAAGAVTAGLVWSASVGLTAFAVFRRGPGRTAAERDRLFREGLAAYLRTDYEAAGAAFRSILRLCPSDAAAHLRLAMVHKAQARPTDQRAALRRCRFYDDDDTWRWEVAREMDEMTRGKDAQ